MLVLHPTFTLLTLLRDSSAPHCPIRPYRPGPLHLATLEACPRYGDMQPDKKKQHLADT